MSVGLSTDLLMDSRFTEMLYSSQCFNNCPNLIDLYISLAAGEGMYLPQLCKTHRLISWRSIVDPIKKAMDAEYERRFFSQLTSGSDIAPAGSKAPETGDNPGSNLGGGIQKSQPVYDYRGEIAPTSLPPLLKAPGAQAGGPSTTRRPFLTVSTPPTPIPNPTPSPGAAMPDVGAPTIPPYIYAWPPEMAPAPLARLSAEELYWERRVEAEKAMLDRSTSTKEYLYETYFH